MIHISVQGSHSINGKRIDVKKAIGKSEGGKGGRDGGMGDRGGPRGGSRNDRGGSGWGGSRGSSSGPAWGSNSNQPWGGGKRSQTYQSKYILGLDMYNHFILYR
jgi:hypothetical protein